MRLVYGTPSAGRLDGDQLAVVLRTEECGPSYLAVMPYEEANRCAYLKSGSLHNSAELLVLGRGDRNWNLRERCTDVDGDWERRTLCDHT